LPRTRRFGQKKTRPNPGHRLKLKRRPRRKTRIVAATLVGVIEPAHLAVHGIHRTERTIEKISRHLEPKDFTRGIGVLRYTVGQAIEIEDLDIPEDAIGDLEDEIRGIMDGTGLTIMSEAQDIVPVDTGHLKESLWYEVDDYQLSLSVGDNAGYASYVENGTVHMPGRPFLRLAMAGNEEEMQAEIDGAIATTLDEQASNEDVGLVPLAETETEIEMETVIETEIISIAPEFL
jgi:HK97 gp10 family phage protein